MGREVLKIEQAIEYKLITKDPRDHLGASIIGKECSRAGWYEFMWAGVEEITPIKLRLFNRGHMEELVVVEDLKNAGCTVVGINIDQSIIDRFKTVFGHTLPSIETDFRQFAHGHGGASKDGIVLGLPDAPKTPHLLEVKTSNLKGFTRMKAVGLEKANTTHFVQCQIYMKLFKLKYCLYIMCHKDTDQRHYERIKFNKKVANFYIDRANKIVESVGPPPRINEDKEVWPCTWSARYRCKFIGVCHEGASPLRSCRTCENVILAEEGKWKCGLNRKVLSHKKQLKGCLKYQVWRFK